MPGFLDIGRPGLVLLKALERLFGIEDVSEVPPGIGGEFLAGITGVLNTPGGLCLVQDNAVTGFSLLSGNSPVLCLFALVLLALLRAADQVVGHALGLGRSVDDLLGILVQHFHPA